MKYRLTKNLKRSNKLETVYSVQSRNKNKRWITTINLVVNKYHSDNTTVLAECTIIGRYIYFERFKNLLGGQDFKSMLVDSCINGISSVIVDEINYKAEHCYTCKEYPILSAERIALVNSDILIYD